MGRSSWFLPWELALEALRQKRAPPLKGAEGVAETLKDTKLGQIKIFEILFCKRLRAVEGC